MRSAMSVQSSLVMYPIYAYGDEHSARISAPSCSRRVGRLLGLTSPIRLDPGGMTRARKFRRYKLRLKLWINQRADRRRVVCGEIGRRTTTKSRFILSGRQGAFDQQNRRQAFLRASITGRDSP